MKSLKIKVPNFHKYLAKTITLFFSFSFFFPFCNKNNVQLRSYWTDSWTWLLLLAWISINHLEKAHNRCRRNSTSIVSSSDIYVFITVICRYLSVHNSYRNPSICSWQFGNLSVHDNSETYLFTTDQVSICSWQFGYLSFHDSSDIYLFMTVRIYNVYDSLGIYLFMTIRKPICLQQIRYLFVHDSSDIYLFMTVQISICS